MIKQDYKDYDFEFIKQVQGYKENGYVPSQKSGVTIGVGFDLSAQSINQMKSNIPQFVIKKLEPFCNKNLKGYEAKNKLKQIGLYLEKKQIQYLNNFMMDKYIKRLQNICKKQSINLNSFSPQVKTVLLSRVIHSWNLKSEIKDVLKQNNIKQLTQILQSLQGFGQRGIKESNYIKKSLNKKNIQVHQQKPQKKQQNIYGKWANNFEKGSFAYQI